MKVAITGSSGFIGSHLSERLEVLGHEAVPLWRYLFTQDSPDCLVQSLAGCSAVVNLAGAPLDRRWTDAYKLELMDSRIRTTRKLVEAVNLLHEPPGVMISTSAVGYYSPNGYHAEHNNPSDGSIQAKLCDTKEAEAELFHVHAYWPAVKCYQPMLPFDIDLKEPVLAQRCRMTLDESPYYNPDAVPFCLEQPLTMLGEESFRQRKQGEKNPLLRLQPGYESAQTFTKIYEAALNRALQEMEDWKRGDA